MDRPAYLLPPLMPHSPPLAAFPQRLTDAAQQSEQSECCTPQTLLSADGVGTAGVQEWADEIYDMAQTLNQKDRRYLAYHL